MARLFEGVFEGVLCWGPTANPGPERTTGRPSGEKRQTLPNVCVWYVVVCSTAGHGGRLLDVVVVIRV